MKIADLKQPYRRMAEYLAENNTDKYYDYKEMLEDAFDWDETSDKFWYAIYNGNHPPITEEIKKHFPDGFDFSWEEVNDVEINKENMSLFDKENKRKIEDENLQKAIYTKLAKEGKFDELPDTCEFSEPVEMLVKDYDVSKNFRRITGKFKGNYMDIHCIGWKNVQLPTPKIDFSEFKNGDIVEIVTINNEKIYGLLFTQNFGEISLTFSYQSDKAKVIFKEDIKSITKIK